MTPEEAYQYLIEEIINYNVKYNQLSSKVLRKVKQQRRCRK